MKKHDPSDKLTIGEAALEVRVSQRTIQRWLKKGLAFKKYGGSVRIVRSDLEAYGTLPRKDPER